MAISNYAGMLNAYSAGYTTSNTADYANQRQQYAYDTWTDIQSYYQDQLTAYYPTQQGLGSLLGAQPAPVPAPAKPESNLAWLDRRVDEMRVSL